MTMLKMGRKSLLVGVLATFFITFTNVSLANSGDDKPLDAGKEMLHHIADAHDWHFFSIGETHVTLPLPVILYSKEDGLKMFMSSNFHHGEKSHDGYRLITEDYIKEKGLDEKKFHEGDIIKVDASDMPVDGFKLYDFSITKNVLQMIIAIVVLLLIMRSIAKKYAAGTGVATAPNGLQNAIEPVITFIRDDVAKPNMGKKYTKYLPFLLTVFFFILINNLFGLLPGSANVTGNIAFTAVLGLISCVVILASTTGYFWKHIFWPPVPHFVKPILIPVELLGVFTKPFALVVRLFANMTAGHIIILSFVSLIFIFGKMSPAGGFAFSPVSMIFATFIYVIEVMVAFIQAYIFTNLSAVFIGQAMEEHHHEEAH
jgi:F-type H+-transporting ATPase subunit a